MHPRPRRLPRAVLGLTALAIAGGVALLLWPSSEPAGERNRSASNAPTSATPGTSTTSEASTTSTAPPAPAPRRTLVEYLQEPGDQVIVVPDGTYAGGTVTARHAATDGAYDGWLILVAESRGGVVVDLSADELVLSEGSSRVLFVGFAFENGRIRNHGNQIRYWYTSHTFPYDAWVEAGGPDGVHARPKAMVIGDSKRVGIFGADFTDIGDDGINIFAARDIRIHGTVFDRISNAGHNDLIHADAIQVQGDVRRMTIRQSVLERQHIGTEGKGDVAKLEWDDCWFRGSRSAGITFAVDKGLSIDGSRSRVRSWGHRSGDDRIDIVDGDRRRPGSARRIDVDDDAVVTRPPGDRAQSPAEKWRARHPYDSWKATLFPRT